MPDKLYPYLLRDAENKQFGAGLSSIIKPKKKEKEMNTPKKLVVFFNGEEQAPIEVADVTLNVQDNTIVLQINTPAEEEKNKSQKPSAIPSEDAPSVEGILVPEDLPNETFMLKGADLKALENLSVLRANRIEKKGNATPTHHLIETSIFNIQDVQSVQNAIMELVDAERKLVEDGYAALDVKTPEFVFEDANEYFKLTQACVLVQTQKASSNN